jgi:hypothetical protein
MAYESDSSTVTNALHSSSPVIFTDDTISKILALATSSTDTTIHFDTQGPDANGNVTVPSGTEVVFITSSDTQQTTIIPPANAPVVIFQGKGGVIANLNDGASTVPAHAAGVTDRVVVGSSGNDQIVHTGNQNYNITLGSGNSTVFAGGGHDTVEAGLGNSTVIGGIGNHTIVSLVGHGTGHDFHFVPFPSSTVSSTGNTAQAAGTDSVGIINNTTGVTTTVTGVQYVAVDGGDAIVIAASTVEAGVASLYHAAFGRTGDAGGIEYWFNLVKNGESLHDVAYGMSHSAEFAAKDGALSDTAFITQLYQNTFNRAPDTGGLAYWQQQLTSGASRVDLLAQFASVAALNEQGTIHTEVTIVGTVTIVPHIV